MEPDIWAIHVSCLVALRLYGGLIWFLVTCAARNMGEPDSLFGLMSVIFQQPWGSQYDPNMTCWKANSSILRLCSDQKPVTHIHLCFGRCCSWVDSTSIPRISGVQEAGDTPARHASKYLGFTRKRWCSRCGSSNFPHGKGAMAAFHKNIVKEHCSWWWCPWGITHFNFVFSGTTV